MACELRRSSSGRWFAEQLYPVLMVNLDDAAHIRPARLSELVGATGEELLEAGRSGEDPMLAGYCSAVAVGVRAPTREVDGAARPDLRPPPVGEIADTPFDNEKPLILTRVDVKWRAAAGRRFVEHDRERAPPDCSPARRTESTSPNARSSLPPPGCTITEVGVVFIEIVNAS